MKSLSSQSVRRRNKHHCIQRPPPVNILTTPSTKIIPPTVPLLTPIDHAISSTPQRPRGRPTKSKRGRPSTTTKALPHKNKSHMSQQFVSRELHDPITQLPSQYHHVCPQFPNSIVNENRNCSSNHVLFVQV